MTVDMIQWRGSWDSCGKLIKAPQFLHEGTGSVWSWNPLPGYHGNLIGALFLGGGGYLRFPWGFPLKLGHFILSNEYSRKITTTNQWHQWRRIPKLITHRKLNMEPENTPLEKENHVSKPSFSMSSMLINLWWRNPKPRDPFRHEGVGYCVSGQKTWKNSTIKEKENHLQKCLGRGYVSSLEGVPTGKVIYKNCNLEIQHFN